MMCGLLPATWLLTDALVCSWLGVVILSSAALADRIRLMRKETEQLQTSQRESEQKLRGIFDHAFRFIGLLKRWNRGGCRRRHSTCGVSRSAVLGQFWRRPGGVTRPPNKHGFAMRFSVRHKGDLSATKTARPGPDGILRSIDFLLKPVRDEKGQIVNVVPEGRRLYRHQATEAALRDPGTLCTSLPKRPSMVSACLRTGF